MGILAYCLSLAAAGIYLTALGYELIPDPGKKGSSANKEHSDKFRGILRVGGVLASISLLPKSIEVLPGACPKTGSSTADRLLGAFV